MPAWVDNAGYLHLEGTVTDAHFKYAMQQLAAKTRWISIVERNLALTKQRLEMERNKWLTKWRQPPSTMAQDALRHNRWKTTRKLAATKFKQVPWNKNQRRGFKRFVRERNKQ